jgi:hypothetical protein
MFYKQFARKQGLTVGDAVEFVEDAIRQSVDGLVGGANIKVIRGSGRITVRIGEQSFVCSVTESTEAPESDEPPASVPAKTPKKKPNPAKKKPATSASNILQTSTGVVQ